MLWIHPVLQLLCTLLALYVMVLGVQRFRASHLKQKVMFNWKRHVFYGKIVLIIWFVAFVWGAGAARILWGASDLTGIHYVIGLIMLPLLVTGYATGHVLDTVKKRRAVLPVVHGLNNMLLLGLALYQVWTGIEVVRVFLLP
ncbi:DUF4079 family protein [Desulfovibrio ferrophilus]|uniref:DUF4079 domain-containing protein n=1 Tax=Desulfovibrio ferrophilus TaxID=241368 RepID=A0A2Z6AU90_9BACT|nr:DUF4079 family protein [Desulfovibrio ferrophilus]BBD06797.1 uncharacterized protein DFE_0071 [Desulfovibrio ferrophilus]